MYQASMTDQKPRNLGLLPPGGRGRRLPQLAIFCPWQACFRLFRQKKQRSDGQQEHLYLRLVRC
jgi:hypothetical protein